MRRLSVSMLIALVCTSLFAGSVRYVFGNGISSDDFGTLPDIGALYTDESANILAVRAVHDSVVVFDSLITRGPYTIGDALESRKAMDSFGVYGTLDFAYVAYSRTTSLYPLAPIVAVGAKYHNGASALVLAGMKLHVCLSNLWDAKSTFIQSGKVTSWCAVGASVAGTLGFACTYGVTYSHNVGAFRWEAGIADLEVLGKPSDFGFCLGLGVDV